MNNIIIIFVSNDNEKAKRRLERNIECNNYSVLKINENDIDKYMV